jgi:hypothetical protein
MTNLRLVLVESRFRGSQDRQVDIDRQGGVGRVRRGIVLGGKNQAADRILKRGWSTHTGRHDGVLRTEREDLRGSESQVVAVAGPGSLPPLDKGHALLL